MAGLLIPPQLPMRSLSTPGLPAGVEVWSAGLDVGPQLLAECTGLLSAQERERADRFAFERDAAHFITRRALLRLALAAAIKDRGIDAPSPQQLSFGTIPHTDKPCLLPPALGRAVPWNLTHSAGRAVVAIGTHPGIAEIGVDLERVEESVDSEAITRRFFSAEEKRRLAGVDDPQERRGLFFACWTRKEALLKGVGTGLRTSLAAVTVDPFTTHPFIPHGEPAVGALLTGWQLYPLELEPGWAAALAVLPG